jgi:hypothetical protein
MYSKCEEPCSVQVRSSASTCTAQSDLICRSQNSDGALYNTKTGLQMAKGRIYGDLDNRRGFQIWKLKGLFTNLELTQEWCMVFKTSVASY